MVHLAYLTGQNGALSLLCHSLAACTNPGMYRGIHPVRIESSQHCKICTLFCILGIPPLTAKKRTSCLHTHSAHHLPFYARGFL